MHSMVAHLDAVTCLAVDPNGVFLMSGSKSFPSRWALAPGEKGGAGRGALGSGKRCHGGDSKTLCAEPSLGTSRVVSFPRNNRRCWDFAPISQKWKLA